jgi:hypothetical protein
VNLSEEEYLAHYGTPRHSGRYPWGSGGNVEGLPRNASFLDYVDHLHKQGVSETEIARGMGITTTQLRAKKTIAKNEARLDKIAMAQRLKNKSLSNVAIAERMGLPGESSVRALLAPGAKDNADILTNTAKMLKEEVDANKIVDIGRGVESHLDISAQKLNVAVAMLEEQGYMKHVIPVPQPTTGHDTDTKVLTPPGTTQKQAWENRANLKQLKAVSSDGGRHYTKPQDPISINPNRVQVKYRNEGGGEADGMIYVRDGVEDVSLGGKRYAQVRVQVGDGHYLKGMAMYKDDLPPGIDLQFNTNKLSTGNKLDAMKPMEAEPLPFGAVVRQIVADEGTPHARVTSSMNIVYDEGKWATWSKSLSSQFLSKQPPNLAKAQLNMTYERRKHTFDEINALTNPVIKKKLLSTFAEGTDSSAVHLDAATLSRRDSWHAILPLSKISPSEVYAPRFNDGERVILIRYPHGGTFELPELTVNTKNPEGRKLLGDVPDAIGIHHEVARRLSGADFDGDTVFVVPNPRGKIKHTPALDELMNFDPIAAYKDDSIPPITASRKGQEMGMASNLITDMTIRGAPHSEIVRAVRHSMVVIDAEKHGLNINRSARDNGIAALKKEYQSDLSNPKKRGASTIISRAESRLYVPERKPRPQPLGGPINPKTGAKEYVPTNRMKKTPKGLVPRLERTTKLAEAKDAFDLVSDANTPMERLYAEHSNKLKALANEARLAALNTPRLTYSPSAKKVYEKEVASLDSKLTIAKRNSPLERQALAIANAMTKAKRDMNPNLTKSQIKKMAYQDLETARARMGASKRERQVKITPEEWNAIQAGAITNHKLEQLLANADLEAIRKLATPRREVLMTNAKTQRAQTMLSSGHYTRAQVAKALGVSLTTLENSLK